MGFCSGCGSSEPLVEAPSGGFDEGGWLTTSGSIPQQLIDVSLEASPRLSLGYSELDRVFGGGLVAGSLTLLAGDPGIGKSTLILQIASGILAQRGESECALYVSGEESPVQIRMRADRLQSKSDGVLVLAETNLADIIHWMEDLKPTVVFVDSIQTLYSNSIPSAPGSVAQVRECARLLMRWAKSRQTPVFLTGHVTKEGDIAGPRVLEHMVDVVLYLEGDNLESIRVLRSIKNRFGPTDELALFRMETQGLTQVTDPSEALIGSRTDAGDGSIVVPIFQGSRPFLVEVQALTSPSTGAMPRRVTNGFDVNRLNMLTTVLAKRAAIPLGGYDIVANVVTGIRVNEPAVDLPIALAITSSFIGRALPMDLVVFGEIGLTGEVRQVPQMQRRLQEASRLGMNRAIVPTMGDVDRSQLSAAKIQEVSQLAEAILVAFPGHRVAAKRNGARTRGLPGQLDS